MKKGDIFVGDFAQYNKIQLKDDTVDEARHILYKVYKNP